ncbi:MHC class I polypeptide-related sequence A-like [Trichechus inunguis]
MDFTDIGMELRMTLSDIMKLQDQKRAVNVTLSEAVKGNVILTCWAAGFYAPKITLTWLQDGEPLSMDSQKSGSVLSGGNGTYKTWVSTRLPQGEEQRYSCHLEHSGKNITCPVSHA